MAGQLAGSAERCMRVVGSWCAIWPCVHVSWSLLPSVRGVVVWYLSLAPASMTRV